MNVSKTHITQCYQLGDWYFYGVLEYSCRALSKIQ